MQNELRPIHTRWPSSFRDNNLTELEPPATGGAFTRMHTFVTLSHSSAEGSKFSLFHTARRVIPGSTLDSERPHCEFTGQNAPAHFTASSPKSSFSYDPKPWCVS